MGLALSPAVDASVTAFVSRVALTVLYASAFCRGRARMIDLSREQATLIANEYMVLILNRVGKV